MPSSTPAVSSADQIAFLASNGAGSSGHANGRTLLEHLIATKRVALAWDLPADIAAAALYHSVYGTQAYRVETVSRTVGRERVRSLIGVSAERLAYLFCSLPREDFWERLASLGSERDLKLPTEAGSERVTPHEIFGLVALHAANDFEQCCAADGGPAASLTQLRANLRFLSRHYGTLPWLARGPLAPFADVDDEHNLISHYNAAVDTLAGDAAAASATLRTLAERYAFLPEPFVWLAYAVTRSGERGAQTYLERAETNLHRLGAPWDKRLRYDEWCAFIALLRRCIVPAELAAAPPAPGASAASTFANLRGALLSCEADADADARKPERFYRFIDAYVDPATPRSTTVYPNLASQPWHEPTDFPITAALEAAHREIAAELARIPERTFHRESEAIERAGAWDVFMLFERGRKHERNCALLPTALQIIERFETVRTFVGLIYVSRLLPGTHVEPHRGPTNLRVRCHLPLVVPSGDCALRVATQTRRWESGKCLVFDDFYTHEAWNYTPEPRTVLIVDLWNPALGAAEIRAIRGLQERMLWQTNNLVHYWSNNRRAQTTPDT